MKTVKWLWVVLILLAGLGSAEAVFIVNHSFEADGIIDPGTPTGWTWNSVGGRGVDTGGSALPSDGAHYLWQGNGSELFQITSHVIPAAGVPYTATVDVYNSWRGSPMIVVFYDDGGTPVELSRAWIDSGGVDTWDAWTPLELNFTSTAASVGKNLGIRLTLENYPGNFWVHYDNVRLVINTIVLDEPDNDAQYVSLNPTLAWTTLGTVEYIDLYLAEEDDPNLVLDPRDLGYMKLGPMEPATTTFYNAGPLEYDTTYYWKIIAYEPNTAGSGYIVTASDPFHFTTTGPDPHITTQPLPQTIMGNGTESPSMTIGGTEITHYRWYEQGLGMLTEGVKYTGVETATLTINNAVYDDEGLYYCKAWNDQSAVVESSEPAVLITERLAGWWKFENNLNDSVNDDPDVDGAAEHPGQTSDPNYTDGIDGFSKMFSPGYGLLVIQDSNDFFNFYINGYTVSAWVRTPAPGDDWPPFAGKETGTDGDGFILSADTSTGNAVHILRGTSYHGDGNQYGTSTVDDNQWHMITGVYDADTGIVRLYVDGRFETENTNTNALGVNPNDLVFGAWGGVMQTQYDGDLDDVRIWSYPLTAREIATVYTDFVPGDPLCVPEPAFDVAGPAGDDVPDCRVNLYDLAVLARDEWLTCNWLPTDLCP